MKTKNIPQSKQAEANISPPETVSARIPTRLIPVTDWPKYHPYPSVSALRFMIFNGAKTGFSQCVRRLGKRVLIDEQDFFYSLNRAIKKREAMHNIDKEELKKHMEPILVLQLIGYSKSSPQKHGSEIRDFCPIHRGDKQRSLAIHMTSGLFICHTCGEKGDLIDLYRKSLDLSFPQALHNLAACSGLGLSSPPKNFIICGAILPDDPTVKKSYRKEKVESTTASKTAESLYNMAKTSGFHPYFQKKGIKPPDGVRYGNGCIVVPFYNMRDRIQTVQFIGKQGKRFAKGMKVNGAFFPFWPKIEDVNNTIYICEGIATGGSIFKAQENHYAVLSVGSWSNIAKVAEGIYKRFPERKIVICLDLGETETRCLESLVKTGIPFGYVSPRFPRLQGKDFNDLEAEFGIECVRERLRAVRWLP